MNKPQRPSCTCTDHYKVTVAHIDAIDKSDPVLWLAQWMDGILNAAQSVQVAQPHKMSELVAVLKAWTDHPARGALTEIHTKYKRHK